MKQAKLMTGLSVASLRVLVDIIETGSLQAGTASYVLRAQGVSSALATIFRDTESLQWEIDHSWEVVAGGRTP